MIHGEVQAKAQANLDGGYVGIKRNWIAMAGITVAHIMFLMLFVLEDFSSLMVMVNNIIPFFTAGAALCLISLIVFILQKDNDREGNKDGE